MKKFIVGVIVTMVSSIYVILGGNGDDFLHIFVLNVGQGDAILIQSPHGENILIDGGPDQKVLTELADVLPFFNKTFDYIILTHPDKDHIAGLISVLKRFSVKKVLFTGAYKKDYYSETFSKIISGKNIPVIIADEKSDIALEDEMLIDVLFPFVQKIGMEPDTNDSSIVLKIIFGNISVVFMGDAEALTEEKLLANGVNIRADAIKIGHHGSKNGTTKSFLAAVNPTFSFISVGINNGYHHPHPELLKRLQEKNQEIYRTDKDGRIEIVISKEKIEQIITQSKRTISAPSLRNFSSNRS